MPTRNVVLTERQEKLVASLVLAGRYQNASEVIREGLRMLERREAEDEARLHALRETAAVGLTALDRGDFSEFNQSEALVKHLDDLADRVAGAR
ncbi:MAG: type II toxin-antitoxin system ParD family antitoxin [Chloroflexota bacterium]|nr:MAG: type II toxin-antitoxin system ParD family antitoxin [Chloroflexota bacterium]